MDRRKVLIGISTIGIGIAGYIFNPLDTPQQPPGNDTITIDTTDDRIETDGYAINPKTLLLTREDFEKNLLPSQQTKIKVNDEMPYFQSEQQGGAPEGTGVKVAMAHESVDNDIYLRQQISVFDTKFTAQQYMDVFQEYVTGETMHSYTNGTETNVFNSEIGEESYVGMREKQENVTRMAFKKENICVVLDYINRSTGDLSVNEDIEPEELVNSIKKYASMINDKINNKIKEGS